MADTVRFELVSPEKLLLSEDVRMVVVPGGEGNFGVLPGHMLMISTVRPGIIDVYSGATVSERIFVSGGFAEVTPERCTVLADEAMPLAQLNRGQVEESLKRADAAIASLQERLPRLQGAAQEQALAELRSAEAERALAEAKRIALDAAGVGA
ncbi:MAG TPA: ATP synthase F1 subunit epsilon [Stellaceae bacterium]|nr:ATP synthase F1 subunit epsilon [Stellaceae bacterium]